MNNRLRVKKWRNKEDVVKQKVKVCVCECVTPSLLQTEACWDTPTPLSLSLSIHHVGFPLVLAPTNSEPLTHFPFCSSPAQTSQRFRSPPASPQLNPKDSPGEKSQSERGSEKRAHENQPKAESNRPGYPKWTGKARASMDSEPPNLPILLFCVLTTPIWGDQTRFIWPGASGPGYR
jgi:hypothetical protein